MKSKSPKYTSPRPRLQPQSIIPGQSTLLTDQMRVGGWVRGLITHFERLLAHQQGSSVWSHQFPTGVGGMGWGGVGELEDEFCRGGRQWAPPRFMGSKRRGESGIMTSENDADITNLFKHSKSRNERRQNDNICLHGGTHVWRSEYFSPDICLQLPFPHQNLPFSLSEHTVNDVKSQLSLNYIPNYSVCVCVCIKLPMCADT